jgi:hypothetical protein
MRFVCTATLAACCLLARTAAAQEADPETVEPTVEIHGFASAGAFVSTDNDYIGESSEGSLELFEAAVNVSSQLTDRLRVGLQLFSRNVGDFHEVTPRVDWAYLDYRWRPFLGLRAGIVKMPFGLYNEYVDIDAARLAILLPQSVYPVRNRDVLLSHTGFALYGNQPLGGAGEIDYQAWLGTLTIPRSALELVGAELESADARYVTGAQLFWHPPVEGLRVGGTYLRAAIDFDLQLDPEVVEQLVMAGLVPADFDGELLISQRPDTLWVASAEYLRGPWLFAAEYSRWGKHQYASLPMLVPTIDEDAERFYAMATYRVSPQLDTGVYYSVTHLDAGDRRGRNGPWVENFNAFQRDLAATARYDVDEHWSWKLEGHFIDGTAELLTSTNPTPERYWGLFLFKTTVSF